MSRRDLAVLVVTMVLVACDESSPEVASEIRPTASPTSVVRGRILAVSGDVRVLHVGAPGWIAATAGDPLSPGDSVQTLGNARAALRFEDDGAQTELGPGTTIRMPVPEQPVTHLTQLSGVLVARIEPQHPDSRLEVELPQGMLVLAPALADPTAPIEARVDVDEERTEIVMLHGAGVLERHRGAPVDVPADRFVTIAPDGEVIARGWSTRTVMPIEPADGDTIRTRSAVTFRWTDVSGASGYSLHLVSPDDSVRDVPCAESVARIELEPGAYRWSVVATVDGEPTLPGEERAVNVDVDRVAPSLSVRSPTPGQIIHDGELVIEGTTEPGARLDVDGDPVAVASDGSFRTSRPVMRGIAQVVLRVRDDLGNSRVVSRTVTRQ